MFSVSSSGGLAGAALSTPESATEFAPDDISGLILWFDASDITTITKTGSDKVSDWEDKSANGLDLAQTSDSLRPTWIENGINGLDIIEFFNAQWMDQVADALTRPTNITVLVVHQPDSVTNAHFIAGVPDSGDANWDAPFIGWHVGTENVDAIEGRYWLQIGSTNREWTVSNELSGGTLVSQMLWYDGTDRRSYLDNANSFDDNTFTGDITYDGGDAPNFIVGARKTQNLDEYYDGQLCEIIVYDSAVSTANRASLNTYVAAKWGI